MCKKLTGPVRSESQESRRKQSFGIITLTNTMIDFREFRRQSLQQLRSNVFDTDDYNVLDTAL